MTRSNGLLTTIQCPRLSCRSSSERGRQTEERVRLERAYDLSSGEKGHGAFAWAKALVEHGVCGAEKSSGKAAKSCSGYKYRYTGKEGVMAQLCMYEVCMAVIHAVGQNLFDGPRRWPWMLHLRDSELIK